MNDLPFLVASTPVGKNVKVKLIRKGQKIGLTVKIGKLEEKKEAETRMRSNLRLGMIVEEITPELRQRYGLTDKKGIVVVSVERMSPAHEAGIREGDIIIEIDQKPVRDLRHYMDMISKYKEGDTILFLIKRGGNTIYLTLHVHK